MSRHFSERIQTTRRTHKQIALAMLAFVVMIFESEIDGKCEWKEFGGKVEAWLLSGLLLWQRLSQQRLTCGFWHYSHQQGLTKKDHHPFPPQPLASHDRSSCFVHVNVRSLFRESACDSVGMREGLLCGFMGFSPSVHFLSWAFGQDDRWELYGHYELHTKE